MQKHCTWYLISCARHAVWLHMNYDPKFDERDLEILQVLWKEGPLEPSDLQKQLSFQMKNPALRWLLNDLVERGQLHRRKEGKAFFYGAAIERRPLLEA